MAEPLPQTIFNCEKRGATPAEPPREKGSDWTAAALNRRIDALRARYTVAVMALRRYGGHEPNCTVVLDDYGDHAPLGCSCGYAKALEVLDG